MGTLYVICKIEDSEYAIPAHLVYQLEAYAQATPLPGAPSYINGLIQVRGQVIPVFSLRLRFGLEPKPPSIESRIVVLKLDDGLFGILVDSAREVHTIAKDLFKDPPGLVSSKSAGFIKSVAQLKNRIVLLLDSEKVISAEAFHG